MGQDDVPRLGVLFNDDIVDLAALDGAWRQRNPESEPLPTAMRSMLAAGEPGLARVRTLLDVCGVSAAVSSQGVDLQTIGNPVFPAGDRCGEVSLRGEELPSAPGGTSAKRSSLEAQEPTSLSSTTTPLGHDWEVERPEGIVRLDYEPELVFVMGKRALGVKRRRRSSTSRGLRF